MTGRNLFGPIPPRHARQARHLDNVANTQFLARGHLPLPKTDGLPQARQHLARRAQALQAVMYRPPNQPAPTNSREGFQHRLDRMLAQLPARAANAAQKILPALQQAAQRTGADVGHLFHFARLESSFNPSAKAKTSSAEGLYQFIDSTWLSMVRKFAPQLGLQGLGRTQLLALRTDPALASQVAALHIKQNQQILESATGRAPNRTELYLAHFLGATGATKFLTKLAENPKILAKDLFPAAAKANEAIFSPKGQPRSLAEVYQHFAHKLQENHFDTSISRPAPDRLAQTTLPQGPSPTLPKILGQLTPADRTLLSRLLVSVAIDAPAPKGPSHLLEQDNPALAALPAQLVSYPQNPLSREIRLQSITPDQLTRSWSEPTDPDSENNFNLALRDLRASQLQTIGSDLQRVLDNNLAALGKFPPTSPLNARAIEHRQRQLARLAYTLLAEMGLPS